MTISHFLTGSPIRWLLSLALMGTVGLGAYLLANSESTPVSETKATVLPVRVTKAKLVSSFAQLRTFTGIIKARRISEMNFKRTGEIVKVWVDEGDRVEANQKLAQLDLRPMLTKQKELKAQRDQAKAVLDELVAGPRKEVIDVARAEVEDRKAELARAEANHQRNRRLIERTNVSRQELELTQKEMDSAKAMLRAAERRLDELETGTRKEKITAQQSAVDHLNAQLESLQVDIDDSTIKAPFAGQIARRRMDEGTTVSPEQLVLQLVENHQLEAHIGLPLKLAVKVNHADSYQLSANGVEVIAKVRAVLPTVNPSTRTRTVIFDIPVSMASSFAPSQIVHWTLDETVHTEGIWLPTTALQRGDRGLWSVYVAKPTEKQTHIVQRRDVEVLYTRGDQSLIRGTVQAGELIIIGGGHRVVPGQRVKGK